MLRKMKLFICIICIISMCLNPFAEGNTMSRRRDDNAGRKMSSRKMSLLLMLGHYWMDIGTNATPRSLKIF